MNRIRLVIESELSNVGLMAMAVNKICVFHGMNEVEAYQVELCVSEAATNAIVHAFERSSEHEVSLLVTVESSRLTLECADTGKPMSSEQVERVTRKSLQSEPETGSLSEGGRGLHIIRGVMDEVSYIRDGDSNCLKMTKWFN